MPALRLASLLVAALGTALAVAMGLTTYTSPSHSSAPYDGVRSLISSSLHDSQPGLPPYHGRIGLVAVPPPEAGIDTGAGVGPPVSPAARAWARSAAASDSAALRAWLGPLVLATATTEADTTRITLRRISLEPGCPWMSTLRAVYANDGGWDLRLLRVSANCPRVAGERSRRLPPPPPSSGQPDDPQGQPAGEARAVP
jgi:hypothetical protein